MSFFDKIRAAFARFMSGRYGADQLGFAMVIVSLVMTVISSLTRFYFLTLMAGALLIVSA